MKLKNRNLVSILIVFGFLSISITGICYFIGVKSDVIEVIHVLFGLLFVALIGFHIFYNFSSLKNYSVNRKVKTIRKELIFGTFISFALITIMCLNLDFSFDLANSGKTLLGNGRKKSDRQKDALIFNEISTNESMKGVPIQLIIWLNDDVVAPSVVIWSHNNKSNQNEKIFIPKQKINIPATINHIEDFQRPETKKRISFLPFDNSQMPQFNKIVLDFSSNYNNATPAGNFILNSNIRIEKNLIVYLEINFKDKTELYKVNIDKIKDSVYELKSPFNKFIRKALLIIS